MNKIYANDLSSGTSIHPGEIIADELDAREMKQKDLAAAMDISVTTLSDLLHGRRHISADVALKLESALNISAIFWLNFQNKFDLDKARRKAVTS